mgnify:FL=1
MPEKQSWFENGNPKLMFVFGFISGVALVSLIVSGTLVSMVSGGGMRVAVADTANTANTAVQPSANTATAPTTTKSAVPAVTDKDHIRGSKDAKVVLIEYSDFECPFCERHHPSLEQAIEEYGDDVAWVYRHFPLSFHPEAKPAAVASECASEQGKFWEFADAMFANQSSLGEEFYIETATSLGLNTGAFKTCLSSGKYDSLIASSTSAGSAAGVTGTPATFVNGQLVSGAVPYATLKSMIDTALAK